MTLLLQFKLPVDLTVTELISRLNVTIQPVAEKHRVRTYYDSFDWRLYNNDTIAEWEANKFSLKTLKNNLTIANIELNTVPNFIEQFAFGTVRHQLEPILEMRALLPICTLAYQSYSFNVLNEDNKTLLRIFIEQYEKLTPRILLQPIKGYDKTVADVIEQLKQLGCITSNKPILLSALKQQGRRVNAYSSKLNIRLNPNTTADIAVKIICSELLHTIKANEQGAIDNIDSEFLHDFRVAVRRTRSVLSQLKIVLPEDISSYYGKFFSWLGKITSETRDLDVYLLNFERYKNSLPNELRLHLNPLQNFLLQKQQQAQQILASQLQSTEYLKNIEDWDNYLRQQSLIHSKHSIKRLADKRLKKVYKQVLNEGHQINEQSPGEVLHELRKSCKKLRYLLEFFQTLYDKEILKIFIKSLKELQEVLGNFQDCEVQISRLTAFSEEMQTMNIAEESFVAINTLIANLNNYKIETRAKFSEKFSDFSEKEMQNTFQSLFI